MAHVVNSALLYVYFYSINSISTTKKPNNFPADAGRLFNSEWKELVNENSWSSRVGSMTGLCCCTDGSSAVEMYIIL